MLRAWIIDLSERDRIRQRGAVNPRVAEED
jgi:hypothetical protein